MEQPAGAGAPLDPGDGAAADHQRAQVALAPTTDVSLHQQVVAHRQDRLHRRFHRLQALADHYAGALGRREQLDEHGNAADQLDHGTQIRLVAMLAASFTVGTPIMLKWFTTASPYAWMEGAMRGTITSVAGNFRCR